MSMPLSNGACTNGHSNHNLPEEDDTRYPDGTVRLRNPNIELMDQDILYHLALGSGSHDLVEMFGDVKFVCMGGTPKRMEQFAYTVMAEIGHKLPCGTTLQDISQFSYRYSMYKVGPVLCISHGMGIPSVGILLHEVIKLMYHAKVRDPVFFRIGTCGGVGYEGGTVIISEDTVDGALRNALELTVLGKSVQRPAKLDRRLARELKAMSDPEDPYDTVMGKTMCTYDFYEGQGRLDGAFCDFTEADKMEYLESIHRAGVVNIEMESLAFAALTHHAGVKAAVVCVTLLDRLKGDQVRILVTGIVVRDGTSTKRSIGRVATTPDKIGLQIYEKHGMGIPSVGILLHEVIKLMYHAKVRDPVFFRIGTCGGVGYEGGTVIISEDTVDGALRNALELTVLGKSVQRPAKLDRRLARELKAMSDPEDPYDTVMGKTMCTYDFYEGQGRLDGAFCDFTEADKMEYLESIHRAGVVNIEMESLAFAALTHHAGVKAAVVCVTLLDRLKGDQVLAPKEVLDEWQQRPTKLVCKYMKRYLQIKGRLSLEGHGSVAVKSPRRFKLVQQESETYD